MDQDTKTEIHVVLRRLLKEREMTPRELDDLAGLGREGTRNILRGRSSAPRSATLQAIAHALNVPVGMFFGEVEPPQGPLPHQREAQSALMMRKQPLQPSQEESLLPLPVHPPFGLCDVGIYSLRWMAHPTGDIMSAARRVGMTMRIPTNAITVACAHVSRVAAVQAPGEGFPSDIDVGSWLLVDTEQEAANLRSGVYVLWDGSTHILAKMMKPPEPSKLVIVFPHGIQMNSLDGYAVKGRIIMRFATM